MAAQQSLSALNKSNKTSETTEEKLTHKLSVTDVKCAEMHTVSTQHLSESTGAFQQVRVGVMRPEVRRDVYRYCLREGV